MNISIQKDDNTPIYKQLVEFVINSIRSCNVSEGEMLPSMNELSDALDISKETVKKAYTILRDLGYIEARQGKGVFVKNPEDRETMRVLLIFDKLSTYKDCLLNAMTSKIGDSAQITIRLHNQSIELFQYYLDECLDRFDYYVVTPHFPLDDDTQRRLAKQLVRIPNRKLIMLDYWIKDLPGNYGAVYQDFDHDIYGGLMEGLDRLRECGHLSVITTPSSLYHNAISASIRRFCRDNELSVDFHNCVSGDIVKKGDVFLLINGQLDTELNILARIAAAKGLEIGRDLYIISYNDSPINELVLGGLTTVSTDFSMMGDLAADMILTKSMAKVKSDFHLIRRATF